MLREVAEEAVTDVIVGGIIEEMVEAKVKDNVADVSNNELV